MFILGRHTILFTTLIAMLLIISNTKSLAIYEVSDVESDDSGCALFKDCQVGSDSCDSCTMVCMLKTGVSLDGSNGYCFPASTSDSMLSS